MAKSPPRVADILAALNQHWSRPSWPSEQTCKYADGSGFARSSFKRKQPAADMLRSA